MRALLTAICLVLALPVLAVLGAWFSFDAAAWAVLRHQAATVLPEYALESGALVLGVGVGVVLLGAATAAAVALAPVLLLVLVAVRQERAAVRGKRLTP